MLPESWPLVVIDLKGCFFTIPLHPADAPRFAFTVPAINNQESTLCFHWTVLPQGMLSSPTIRQMFVARAVLPICRAYPNALIYHYMDDILISASSRDAVQTVVKELRKSLSANGLCIAEEKVQVQAPWKYLGWKITDTAILPQPLRLASDIKTLNDLQKLLGTINWVPPYLGITTQDLAPLFALLKGESDLASSRTLTPEALHALQRVSAAIQNRQIHRISPMFPVRLILIYSVFQPYALLCQWVSGDIDPLRILEWVFLAHAFSRTVTTGIEMMVLLIQKGRHRLQSLLAQDPASISIALAKQDFNCMSRVLHR